MKVKNMVSSKGNPVANQFIIENAVIDIYDGVKEIATRGHMFRSYSSNIAFKCSRGYFIDKNKWDYSTTTGKYRNQFLNETKKETQAKIDSGEYILTNLN